MCPGSVTLVGTLILTLFPLPNLFLSKALRKCLFFAIASDTSALYRISALYNNFGELKIGLWRPKFRPCRSLPLNWTTFFEIYIKNTFISCFQSILKVPQSKVKSSKFYYCNSLSGEKINFLECKYFFIFH